MCYSYCVHITMWGFIGLQQLWGSMIMTSIDYQHSNISLSLLHSLGRAQCTMLCEPKWRVRCDRSTCVEGRIKDTLPVLGAYLQHVLGSICPRKQGAHNLQSVRMGPDGLGETQSRLRGRLVFTTRPWPTHTHALW